jgi:hypothetical protein
VMSSCSWPRRKPSPSRQVGDLLVTPSDTFITEDGTLPITIIRREAFHLARDGVLYRGTEIIPGADVFIQQLRDRDISFRLLTNNSQRTRLDILAKLDRMGVKVEEEHVFTSAIATARFLAQQTLGELPLSSARAAC